MTLGEKGPQPLYFLDKIFHYEQQITQLFIKHWLVCLRCLNECYQCGLLASKTQNERNFVDKNIGWGILVSPSGQLTFSLCSQTSFLLACSPLLPCTTVSKVSIPFSMHPLTLANTCPVPHCLVLSSSMYLLPRTEFLCTPISSKEFTNFRLYCVVARYNCSDKQTNKKKPDRHLRKDQGLLEADRAQLNISQMLAGASGPRLLPCFFLVLWAWPSN